MFNSYGTGRPSLPPVTKNLIIINVLIWAIEMIIPSFGRTIVNTLGLHFFTATHFNPVQPLTYMFVHDQSNFMHILFNMFTLWMFGPMLERIWGGRRFLIFYFICGVGAALLQEGVWALTWQNEFIDLLARVNGMTHDAMAQVVAKARFEGDPELTSSMGMYANQMVTIGASGAIYGLLLGFAFVFPNIPMYLFFIPVPIKAKYMVIGYAVIEFTLGVGGSGGTVAHFAHLGGMLFGLIPLLIWKHKGTLRGGNFF